MWAQSLGRKTPWRGRRQLTPALLPGVSHGQTGLVGCSPWGRKELDMTEHAHIRRHPHQPLFSVKYQLGRCPERHGSCQLKSRVNEPTHLFSCSAWCI